MSPRLQDELKQTRPFTSLEEEALLSIARSAAVLDHALAQAMKPFDVTPTQYNVLRILRGAGGDGLCRNEVGERLIRRVPDVTRLLDRMEQMSLIERFRTAQDRRFVTTRVTAKGLELLTQLDAPLWEIQRRLVGHLTDEQLRTLVALLEATREKT